MTTNLIRYKTKPEQSDENERLIKQVFEELRVRAPEGLRYLAVRAADGSFLHFVMVETKDGTNPLLGLESFKAFTAGVKERCAELPKSEGATVVGDYRMLRQP